VPAARPDKTSSDLAFALDLERQGLVEAAEQQFLRLVQTQPKEWRALHQLGAIYLSRGDYVQALQFMGAAMKAKPSSAEAKSNYGYILQQLDRHDEAIPYFNRALAANPAYVSALLNRGTSFHHLGKFTEALVSFDRALAREPGNVKAWYNRANVLHELRRFDEALASFAKAIALKPDYADAHWNEGLTRLLLGDFETGWAKYEWRWQTAAQKHLQRDFVQPLWRGTEPIAGKAILVHAEQGFGDTLQFVRYLPQLSAQGADVVLEVQPALYALLSGVKGAARVLKRGDALPAFDLHCPIMSLPLACRTSLQTIPNAGPYVEAPRERLEAWRARLPKKDGLRVALAWAGSATHRQDRLRSVPLALLRPLLARDDIEWLSVQRDLRTGDSDMLDACNVRQLGGELTDFADTAAILSLADLVITVDTAVAHLAGALGRPAWVLLQYSPDFRWLLDRDDSPWYPTVRLFRQSRFGEWDDPVARTIDALRRHAAAQS